jgi:hypothetical protein
MHWMTDAQPGRSDDQHAAALDNPTDEHDARQGF